VKKIFLLSLLVLLFSPSIVRAQAFISPWDKGLQVDEDKAYSVESRDSANVLVQYQFPSLTATGKELVLDSEFDYAVINSYGLVAYDYREDTQEKESEVFVNASLILTTYDTNFVLVSSKTVDLGSYSYPVGGDVSFAKKKTKKNKEKFLPSLAPSRISTIALP